MSSFPLRLNLDGKRKQAAAIYTGDTYNHQFIFVGENDVPIDKSGVNFEAQIKISRGSPSVIATFDIAITGEGSNVVTLSLASNITDDLEPGNYFWDLQETDGAIVRTLLLGYVRVVSDI